MEFEPTGKIGEILSPASYTTLKYKESGGYADTMDRYRLRAGLKDEPIKAR